MTAFRRKPDTTVVYEPVAYDKFIHPDADGWRPNLRVDGLVLPLEPQPTLKRAQQVLDEHKPDVFEGAPVPMSVFYPTSKECHA